MLTNYDYIVDRESKFGTIHFDYIDDNRLVNYKRTALLVFRIESWFDNNGYGFRRGFMIPENSKHAVEHYKSLLMDDITLSFNEALFLLLGLDVLSLALSQFVNMDLINYKKSVNSSNTIENVFAATSEYYELVRSDLNNGRIKRKHLVELGERHDFFFKKDKRISKRNLNESVSKKLHTILISSEYIIGDYNNMWLWTGYRNELSYLAKILSHKLILKGKCHKELSYYIHDQSEAKRPLANIKNPSNTKGIDNIIKQLIA
jgi:hypothetical protein